MTVLIDVTGFVAGMVVVIARRIAVAVVVDVSRLVAGMVMVIDRGVAVAVWVEIAGFVSGMLVMGSGLFFWHGILPGCSTKNFDWLKITFQPFCGSSIS